jgi:hypothetical protein
METPMPSIFGATSGNQLPDLGFPVLILGSA